MSHGPGVLTTLLTYGRSFCDSSKPVHSHLASYFRGKEGVWHTMCPYAVPQSVYTAILTFNLLATSHSLMPKCISILLLQKPLPRYQSLLVFLKPLIRFQPYTFPVPSSMPAPSSCLFWKHVLHSTSCTSPFWYYSCCTRQNSVWFSDISSFLQPFHSLYTINQDFNYQHGCPY